MLKCQESQVFETFPTPAATGYDTLYIYYTRTWSLTLREECRLRVFENRVLRRIFGPKRDEVTGE
jgi:hypothetical protein